MNLTTIFGIFSGFSLVIASVWLTSKNALLFLNFPGLIIVLGGTIAATLISFPPKYVLNVWGNFLAALKNENTYDRDDINEIAYIARLWKKGEIRLVDAEVLKIQSPFLRTGLTLVVDKAPIDDINELLDWRIQRLKTRENAEANVFRAMSSYAPAFGMMGTLIGLVNMVYDMSDGGFNTLGINMAVALTTTFYGLILSNLVFKPIATKLEDRTEQRVRTLSMAQEAVNLISEERSPAYIRETLYSFLKEYEDEVSNVRGESTFVKERKHKQSSNQSELE